jgi:hypothetical protein
MTYAEAIQTLEDHPNIVRNVRGGLMAEAESSLGKEAYCVHLLQVI